MTYIHHTLVEEFGSHVDKMRQLSIYNHQFAKLHDSFDKTHAIINRIETGQDEASESFLEDLKKNRLWLKDALYSFIAT